MLAYLKATNTEKFIYLVFAIIIFFLVSLPVQWIVLYATSKDNVEFTALKTERVTYRSGEDIISKYLVFTDKGVFECVDSILFWKFNSSDIYGQIQPNHRYRCKVAGWRIQFLSSYPNIITCTQLD